MMDDVTLKKPGRRIAHCCIISYLLDRQLKDSVPSLVKKVRGARRARDPRAEAYLESTLERVGRAQLSQRLLSAGYGRWAFFNRL
jgi:hypothetical protein